MTVCTTALYGVAVWGARASRDAVDRHLRRACKVRNIARAALACGEVRARDFAHPTPWLLAAV